MIYSVRGGKLIFSIDTETCSVSWSGEGLPTRSVKDNDFFRVFLDNGVEREIAVFSRMQRGSVTQADDGSLFISYEYLTDEFGREYDVRLCVTVSVKENAIGFSTEIENCSDVRVNEIQCPFVSLVKIADEDTARDTLYRPVGLGERLPNPIDTIRRLNHSEYMFADYDHIWRASTYPYDFSMAWLGVESGGHFLYLGRHDEKIRTCSMIVGTSPRNTPDEMVFAVSHFPAAKNGEKLNYGECVLSLMEGGWKSGADFYKLWANNLCKCEPAPDWVQNMTGWQRIILKHQFGRIFFKYKDLVDVWKNGKKYGLDTLLVFGWWRGCFDNGYPNYEPDDELGGAEALKEAIAEIQRLGGRVILYNNGVLLDVTTDYYKNVGQYIEKKNIDGTSYREYYSFADYGMMLRTFGYKSFSSACHATEEWKAKLIENAKIKIDFGPDSIFFDQLGGHLPRLCFDSTHKHGNRIDEDVTYKIENVRAVRATIPRGKCIGTENVLDVMSGCFDFSHGCIYAGYKEYRFPSLFRYTFPEVIVTNRFAHDEKAIFKHELNFAFVNGLRFDVAIYRGRLVDVSAVPNYANHLKELLDLKEEYRKYFYEGRFLGEDTSIEKPRFITANLFEAKDGARMLALWNESDSTYTLAAYGKTFKLLPNQVIVEEI